MFSIFILTVHFFNRILKISARLNCFQTLFPKETFCLYFYFYFRDPRVRAEACVAFEQFLDPNIIHDIVYGRVKLPSFVEFVNHVSCIQNNIQI